MVAILTGTRKDVQVMAGDRSPLDGQWGDYLTVRPVFSGPPNNTPANLFAATGYTMNGAGDGSNRDATPRFVVFGRSGDVGAIATGGPGPVPPGPGPVTPAPAPPVPSGPLPPTPPGDGGPITDVNALPVVSPAVAGQIKDAAMNPTTPQAAKLAQPAPAPIPLDKPGKERWPVKTGQDQDRAKVGKNIIKGNDLGAGIVASTIEELISLPRPQGLEVATQDPPQFQSVRDGVTEVTIWQIEATIIALKHEADGDYHLVLQGTSGQEMVGEIPTPTTEFVGDSSWLTNIGQARQEVDNKLVQHLSPADFTLVNNKYLPHGALASAPNGPRATAPPQMRMTTRLRKIDPPQPLFSTQITSTQAGITGVGFFDRAHGATGAAPNVIELHPVLKVEWL